MMTRKGGIVVAMVAILALTAAMPIASASNITAVVSPSTNSANVTAYVNTTATVKTNSPLGQLAESILANVSNGSSQIVLTSSNTTFIDFQNAIQNKSSSAELHYMSINASRTFTKVSSQELVINLTMKIVLNVTHIFHNGTLNLAWRGFQNNQSVVIDKVNYNKFQIGNISGTSKSSLDFHAFSEPLTNWSRSYNEITNKTSFTMDAGYTLNYTKNTSSNGIFFNVTVKSDPSYSIVTPGYAVASANSLTYTSPPSSGLSKYLYYVVLVVIVAVGFGVAASSRRRRR